jgi:NTE family protein
MEGGGMLGIALVGYIYALEQANIRFLGIGGSSVGAIVALLLSCLDQRTEEKGAAMAELISNIDMGTFVDGKFFARALSRLIGSGKAAKKKLQVFLLSALSSSYSFRELGLNPGDSFFKWLSVSLEKAGIHTMNDARKMIESYPDGMIHRDKGQEFIKPSPSLKLVAADLTTCSKVVFPEMAPL